VILFYEKSRTYAMLNELEREILIIAWSIDEASKPM
jgi:hypothetical protein